MITAVEALSWQEVWSADDVMLNGGKPVIHKQLAAWLNPEPCYHSSIAGPFLVYLTEKCVYKCAKWLVVGSCLVTKVFIGKLSVTRG